MEEPLILDRYRPLADLGAGGHGSVVLAFDTKMARRVAIKRLPLPRDRSGVRTAPTGLAEARTAAMLNHPNIVIVHEWDADSDEAFIVMEALDGPSLADLLDETGEPFTLDEIAAIVAGISAAMSFAHANGVLHLDLKPANVIVTRDGRTKVADFGVSALTDITGSASGTVGTIGYMPPEQIRGEQLDERTDCWALAALTFELLTNANPFDADTPEGSLFRIEVADLPAPSEFEAGIPRPVDDVLVAALAADPDERYETVDEFARALMPFLGDPERGRRSLVELVAAHSEDEEEADLAPLGLWDRLAPYAGRVRRAGAALACAWLVWAGTGVFALQTPARAAATALVALAGALAPGLGLALGYGAFVIGAVRALGLLTALPLGVVLTAFWAARARVGESDGMAPIFGPALGMLRAAAAVPLLLGFVFPPLTAAFAAGIAAIATMTASAVSGAGAPLLAVGWRFASTPLAVASATAGPLERLVQPGTGIAVLGWMLAAAVCSSGCRRGTRGAAFAGVLAGGVTLVATYAAWSWLAGEGGFGPEAFGLDLTIGIAIGIIVTALGAPTRPEEE